MKKIFLNYFLIGIVVLLLLPQNALANEVSAVGQELSPQTDVQEIKDNTADFETEEQEEPQQDDVSIIRNIEILQQNNSTLKSITPMAAAGGGTLSCKGYTGKSICDIALFPLDPVYGGKITISYYTVKNGVRSFASSKSITLKNLSHARAVYRQVETKHAIKGTYEARVEGYLLSYYHELPLTVKSIWSAKFKVK